MPVATVIDVGVLSGTPELVEAYPDRPHLLFEPVAEFAPTIERNYRNVQHQLVQAAVSDTSGETRLRTVGMIGDAAISHSFMTESAEQASRTVPRVSLDDYLRANPAQPPYFLKIDIDGDELKVLAGATETLRLTSVVMIEVTIYSIIERMQRSSKPASSSSISPSRPTTTTVSGSATPSLFAATCILGISNG